jgi:hypothetical protein
MIEYLKRRNKMKVWLCGAVFGGSTPEDVDWGFNGIYLFKKSAIKSCKFQNDFIAPFNLNLFKTDTGGHEAEFMKDVEYPLWDNKKYEFRRNGEEK